MCRMCILTCTTLCVGPLFDASTKDVVIEISDVGPRYACVFCYVVHICVCAGVRDRYLCVYVYTYVCLMCVRLCVYFCLFNACASMYSSVAMYVCCVCAADPQRTRCATM